jgi:hypothetical protein
VVAAGAALGVSEGQGVSAVVIQIVGLVAGGGGPGLEGQYVESYTPDGNEGRGRLVLTPHVQAAKRYTGHGAALAEWKRVSATHPTRPDGKPNRPMTAFTVRIEAP